MTAYNTRCIATPDMESYLTQSTLEFEFTIRQSRQKRRHEAEDSQEVEVFFDPFSW